MWRSRRYPKCHVFAAPTERSYLARPGPKPTAGRASACRGSLWRLKSNAVFPVEKRYSDRSFASYVYPGTKARRNHTDAIAVRVVEYTLAPGDVGAEADRTYRLLTTITDSDAAPPTNWHSCMTRDGRSKPRSMNSRPIKRRPGLVLRSNMPVGVIQEVYGYLCVHYAIRWLMHSTAKDFGHDPGRITFTRSLRAARRTTASHPGFPLTPGLIAC
jgi:hypothetical protein